VMRLILVTNQLPEPTAVHWHGLLLPSGMDGVTGLSQRGIEPGETFAYEFTLRQHGTYMYHPHADEAVQMAMGMMGFFVIHPRRPARRIDRDFCLFAHEWYVEPGSSTPNPNAKKFILREPLTWGISRAFENEEQARDDALASQLFAIEHVTNVFYVDHWITVTQDGSADWQELMRKLAVPIRDAPSADEGSAQIAGQVATGANFENLSEADRARLDRINEILDEQVRPYLQGDGGDLYVLGLEQNRLMVHYQGACGSCPSAISGTLAGIESLVRQIEPDLEVVAV